MLKCLALGMLSAMLIMVGCGGDENGPTAVAQPPEMEETQTRSFEIELTDVDDEALVYVNGRLAIIRTFESHENSARSSLDPFLEEGDNRVEVYLYNPGCFATSLTLAIYENGVQVVPPRRFQQNLSHCGFQVQWNYTINPETGVTALN